MNTEEVRVLVQEIHRTSAADGVQKITELTDRLEADGWKLQIRAWPRKEFHARRGRRELLRKPRNQWMIGAAWVRGQEKVHYYTQEAPSKAYAIDMQERYP